MLKEITKPVRDENIEQLSHEASVGSGPSLPRSKMTPENLLERLILTKRLSSEDFESFVTLITKGEIAETQIGAFLAIVREDFINVDTHTLKSMVNTILRHSLRFPKVKGLVDIVGTGGDRYHTFNISTAAAIVCAGAGLKVAKHGNRSSRSKAGSSDILETLGSVTNVGASQMYRALKATNFCFISAFHYHPLMRIIGKYRRSIGIRTIFNQLGPLISPARPENMVVGVSSEKLGDLLSSTLVLLGVKRLWVVFGEVGIDEISTEGKTVVWEYARDNSLGIIDNVEYLSDLVCKSYVIKKFKLCPETFGMESHPVSSISTSSCMHSVRLLESLLFDYYNTPIAIRNSVIMTAAAALYITLNIPSLKEACSYAIKSIKSGSAASVLNSYINMTKYVQ